MEGEKREKRGERREEAKPASMNRQVAAQAGCKQGDDRQEGSENRRDRSKGIVVGERDARDGSLKRIESGKRVEKEDKMMDGRRELEEGSKMAAEGGGLNGGESCLFASASLQRAGGEKKGRKEKEKEKGKKVRQQEMQSRWQ